MHYRKSNCHSHGWQQHGCNSGKFAKHGGFWGKHFMPQAPVNIEEKPDSFEIHLFAPGLRKEDFIIGLSGSVMSISLKEDSSNTEHANFIRREYRRNAFERRFELGDKIDTTAISAKYSDGVLQVTLPKKVADTPAQNISID